ncbi:tetratricopeptide repeat protein [Rhodoplanes sp. Z2-YC6860]|uniref:tetratricopeptide repeat protein n=1 Tax=Rhodoplanes sp. Z2-YC6860 TaxID=674703 RepID=UPI00078BB311|nr:tetratricopeptide repeat protein [Rhodoplanes sp. Z2-YC6860]AMN41852.1 Sel1 domain-containing protein repeat-containing protein [Rhodoplanes sp. Z2-YC6860]
MRISSAVVSVALIALAFGGEPASALDGTPSPNAVPVAPSDPSLALAGAGAAAAPAIANPAGRSSASALMPTSLGEAMKSATEALRSGEKAQAVISLEYAAEHGHSYAQWKLGRMFADGDGVQRDELKAFNYFQKLADSYADDNPAGPRARFVSNAFVALGNYYLEGIPNTSVTPSPELARRMFGHAASYFGDPEAQYQLASLYLNGNGVARDPKRAVPWLVLASNKGHYRAQAVLGRIMFYGEHGIRQRAAGLMWLTVACDGPGAKEPWIAQLRENAVAQATDDERAMAFILLKRWVEGRRD